MERERERCLNCGKARISPGSSPIDVSREAQLGRRPSFEEGKKSLQLNFSFSHFAPPPSSFSFPLANSPRGQLSFSRLLEIARKLKKKRRMEKEELTGGKKTLWTNVRRALKRSLPLFADFFQKTSKCRFFSETVSRPGRESIGCVNIGGNFTLPPHVCMHRRNGGRIERGGGRITTRRRRRRK